MLKGAIGEFMSLNAKWNPLVFYKSKTAIACWNDVKNNVIHSNWIHSSQEKIDVWKHSPIKYVLNFYKMMKRISQIFLFDRKIFDVI